MGDHLGIIIFSSILLILLNSLNCLISLSELQKTPNDYFMKCCMGMVLGRIKSVLLGEDNLRDENERKIVTLHFYLHFRQMCH